VALLKAPKQSRRRQATPRKTLRELDHGTTKLRVLAGRYGPYVTDGTTNASIPKTVTPEALTLEQAVALLEARRLAGPAPRRATGRKRASGARGSTAARRKTAEA
jgi:DNA topoisomerase-1